MNTDLKPTPHSVESTFSLRSRSCFARFFIFRELGCSRVDVALSNVFFSVLGLSKNIVLLAFS